jgi:hypothetical protein
MTPAHASFVRDKGQINFRHFFSYLVDNASQINKVLQRNETKVQQKAKDAPVYSLLKRAWPPYNSRLPAVSYTISNFD